MTPPYNFNKLVPPFLRYKNSVNLVGTLLSTIQSYAENPSIFFKNCDWANIYNIHITIFTLKRFTICIANRNIAFKLIKMMSVNILRRHAWPLLTCPVACCGFLSIFKHIICFKVWCEKKWTFAVTLHFNFSIALFFRN